MSVWFLLKKVVKKLQKDLEVKKKVVPLHSHLRKGCPCGAKLNDKFIEKTDLLYKKQVPRNTIYREALILLKGIISVRTS